jgi:coproporphyrinogen III oxidase
MASIDHSIPLSWTVTRWSSKDGHGGGRHRRMIVGYDAEREEVFFSDPWGFKMEKEIMPMRAAFAMTIWMQAIYPASMHHAE